MVDEHEAFIAWLLTPEGRGFIEAWAEKLPAV